MTAAVIALAFGKGQGGGPVLAVSLYAGLIVLFRRVTGSRIILGVSALSVIDPLRVWHVPYGAVRAVDSEGGALVIELADDEELRPTAFGASVVDHFVRSSERAAREIRSRLRELPEGEGAGEVRTEFRRDWASEAAAVVALVLGVIALLMGI